MVASMVLMYIVENRATGESTEFSCDDWLAAREQAVTLAVEQKAASERDDSYQGIRLCSFSGLLSCDRLSHLIAFRVKSGR